MPFSIAAPEIDEQEKEQFSWSGYTRADIADVYDLLQTVNRADDADYNETQQDLEQTYDDAWLNPLTDARVIRNVWGKLVALARVFVNPKPTEENVCFIECEIAPEARGQGLEQETFEWMEDRARDRLAQTAGLAPDEDVPSIIRTDFNATNTRAIELWNARGYQRGRAFYKMNRDLNEPIPDAPLSDGLELRVYDASLDEKIRQAFNESFRDHWGHQEVPPEEWRPFVMDVSTVRQDLSLVVMDGDEVAAFAINCERAAENERYGIRRAWTTKLGTRRAWRKRGIATFLLAESMRRFRAEGFDYAGLGVDAENLTGALALYERLGYRAYKTRVVLEKRIG